MRKVFVDVGAHDGETLSVVQDKRWGFDLIYCFEPAPQCLPALEQMADDRTTILPFGLWNSDTTMALHDPGKIGASLFAAKALGLETVDVQLRDGAEWFRETLSDDDEVVVKINCEGAECDLLDHLLAADELRKVDEMVVHFDVRKIPGSAHREATTRAALNAAGVRYRVAESVMFGRSTQEKTENWMRWYHAPLWKRPLYSHVRRLEMAARVAVWRRRRHVGRLT